MMLFRLQPGDGLLIGVDAIRVFIHHVEVTDAGVLLDVGVHAPKSVAINRDTLPTALHKERAQALAARHANQA